MTLTERIQRIEAERRLPNNVIPMARHERRSKPAWRERMDAEGLPVKVEFRRTDESGWAA